MGIFDFKASPVYCPNQEIKYFSAAGTGYLKLSDIAENINMQITAGNPNKLEMAIGTSMVLSTSLLSLEIVNPLSLQDAFGVGYEVVHPLKSEFSKFKDLSYFFWKVEEAEKGTWIINPFPFLSFKYSYQGDVLIIRSVRTSSSAKTQTCNIDSDELHVISPIHKTFNPEELLGYTPQTLNSKWMCNVFIWKNLYGKMGTYASFSHFATQKPPIVWTNEFSKNQGIDINVDFLKNYLSQIAHMTD